MNQEKPDMIKTPILFLLSLLISTSAFSKEGIEDYEVTITNLTKSQIFAPSLAVTHRKDFNVFRPGYPAIPELATQAEAGNPGPLQSLLDDSPNDVLDTNNSGGVLMPGESATLMISGSSKFDHLTLTAMLVTTNDAFAGLNGAELPKRSATWLIPAYDAGSEENDEDCANIPGPPCGDMDDSGNAGEGYVYIGNGIQGIGDVDPAEFDWNNPVARVQVRRVR
jgi:hypothetical protein